MAVLQVKSFIIDSTATTDSQIASGINVTSTVFSVSIVPISNSSARVVVVYN